jgi:uncharacterized protein with HEPN domain
MRREIGDYIQDAIDAMAKSMEFINGMNYEDFIQDDKTIFAVIRAIEIIGESVKNIPDQVKKEYPEVSWREMAGMRDKLIHGYFGVDERRVWKTVKEEIPPLKPLFEKILKKLD